MLALFPDLPLVVVSEFPPAMDCRWIPYHVRRTFRENWELCRASLKDNSIRLSAVILQPRMPYWPMRAIAFLLSPWNFLAFNEGYGHFMLRPRSVGTILRHMLWRTRNWFVWEFSPGGAIYTGLWRLAHPRAFRRPLLVWLASITGDRIAARKRSSAPGLLPVRPDQLPRGISVVIPSRNGKELLARILPNVVSQLGDLHDRGAVELIVVDNGSEDGSAEFLHREYPEAACIDIPAPLSFSRAVNTGLAAVTLSHVCLLNNDMLIAPDFFEALAEAFVRVPELFCATAQIFLPEGAAREETGKAIMPPAIARLAVDFPVRCDLPIPGEDLTYVLYGSGGCSLFDTSRLRQLEGLDTIYEPAYVEDLDLGVRAWQQGWPTVFVSQAEVLHWHRTTTRRYYSPEALDRILELNYLRFLVRTVADPQTFHRMWRQAIERLNLLAARPRPYPAALQALELARKASSWLGPRPSPIVSDDFVFAIGNGSIAVFPGVQPSGSPVILIVSPYVPFPLSHGGAVRMYNLMSRAAHEFDQVLVTFADELNPVPDEVLALCTEVVVVKRFGSHARPSTARPDVVEEFDSAAFHAVLRQTVRKWQPVIAQLEFTQMAQYAADCAPAKTILVEHDITLDLIQQMLRQGEDWELRRQLDRWIRFEREAWRTVDCVVTMSDKDRSMVTGDRAITLANGVDIQRFRPDGAEPEPYRLLFIGSFAHLPNVLALEFFLDKVWPALQALPVTLHVIAGSRPQYYLNHYRDRVRLDLDQPSIEVEEFVSDVRPAYEGASIVVAPLLASAGTNIKIMEAMAMGKAIVSTRAGINGLDLQPGRDLVVEDRPEAMAQAIIDLLKNPERRHEIGNNARETVGRLFDWNVIAERQSLIYRELAADAEPITETRPTASVAPKGQVPGNTFRKPGV
jgi:O-antigen biosynthesis protein